jgi:hypothetical protein
MMGNDKKALWTLNELSASVSTLLLNLSKSMASIHRPLPPLNPSKKH